MNIFFIFRCFPKHRAYLYNGFIFIYLAVFLNSKDIFTTNIFILYLAVSLNTEDIYITDVRCGGDGTMFISHDGDLYACGSNKVKFCLVNK